MRHTPTTTARPSGDTLIRIIAAAAQAPSVLNTQPWLWQASSDRLHLFAERARQLSATDPQGRLLTLSCGASLHHARTALAAAGWSSNTVRLPDPDPDQPDLLATLVVTGRTPITAAAVDLARAISRRHTDRRPVSEAPAPTADLEAIEAAARGEAGLHVFTPSQVLDLATAACRAAAVQADERPVRAELRYWTGPAAPQGAGIPAEALPEHLAHTTVPGRDFGHAGTLPIGPGHDRAATYAVLFGDADEPRSWLRSGEALSALWLTATVRGVSVVPLSDVIEVTHTRQALRRFLGGVGYPHLVLRLGIPEPEGSGYPRTPRFAIDEITVPRSNGDALMTRSRGW